MKQMEKLIITTCVLLVLGLIVQFGARKFIPFLDHTMELDSKQVITITVLAKNVSSLLVPLVIAGWLYREAKRDNNYPWVWVLLALTYQYLAPIFYVALKIYQQSSAEESGERLPS